MNALVSSFTFYFSKIYLTYATIIAMYMLYQKTVLDAELDASARYPPPRCHPGTRKEHRERIISWILNSDRTSNLLWLYGSVGVGKSALCQTVAEYCKSHRWFGAAFFFSRPDNCDDPSRVVPSLAYRLAANIPAYKNIIVPLLAHDISILEMAVHAQFHQLIIKPLSQLETASPLSPVLILLDGLDECKGDAAQREFIRLIGGFAASSNSSKLPFVWIISSRPEWQIVSTFSSSSLPIPCQREELFIDSADALKDVSRFLRDGFNRIRDKYDYAFDDDTIWPTEAQFMAILHASSGLFIFSSTILKFVDNEETGNPVAQLDVCLEFLKGNLLPKGGNPLDSLDTLYVGILRTIHPDILPTTFHILSILLFVSESFSAQTVANFLFLDQSTFYASLRRLYSVLDVPGPKIAQEYPIKFLHASFGDFLKRFIASGDSPVTQPDLKSNIEKGYIRWVNIWTMVHKAQQSDPLAAADAILSSETCLLEKM